MRWRRRYTVLLYGALGLASLLVFWPLSDDSALFRQGVEAARQGDFPETYALWKPLAEKGYPRAQYGLGVLYERGDGVARDLPLAAQWYQRAANQDIWEAQVNLGLLLITGEGVERDYTAAAEWFRRAAEQGSADAQVNLGNLYLQGWGVAQDATRATRWFRAAAQQGNALGQLHLARQLAAAEPPQLVDAYVWATAAAQAPEPSLASQADSLHRQLRPRLSAAERAEAERRLAGLRRGR